MPQLVACSGFNPVQPLKPPARIGAAASDPPSMEIPGGSLSESTQAAALPGVPLPAELCTFHAPDPAGGKAPTAQRVGTTGFGEFASAPKLYPSMRAVPAETSPTFGARKEVAQPPLTVRSSIGPQ